MQGRGTTAACARGPKLSLKGSGGALHIPVPDAPGWPRGCDQDRVRVRGRHTHGLTPVVARVRVMCAGPRAGVCPGWTAAVTLPYGRDGLSVRRMMVVCTVHKSARGCPVHSELLRNALPDLTPDNIRNCLPLKKLRRDIQ
jgi:hypothetical protein